MNQVTGYWGKCSECEMLFPIPLFDLGKIGLLCDVHKSNQDKKEEKKFVEELIQDKKKELAHAKVWNQFVTVEYTHPRKMGKIDALAAMKIWEERIKGINDAIEMYKSYLQEL